MFHDDLVSTTGIDETEFWQITNSLGSSP